MDLIKAIRHVEDVQNTLYNTMEYTEGDAEMLRLQYVSACLSSALESLRDAEKILDDYK